MKAVIACAHKLLRIIYKILATHQEYDKEKVLGLRNSSNTKNLKNLNYSIAQEEFFALFLMFFFK